MNAHFRPRLSREASGEDLLRRPEYLRAAHFTLPHSRLRFEDEQAAEQVEIRAT